MEKNARIHYLLSCYATNTIQKSEWEELQQIVNVTDDAVISSIFEEVWNNTDYKKDDEGLYKEELSSILSRIQKTTRRINLKLILNRTLKVASILLIPLLISLSIYLYQFQKYIVFVEKNEIVVDVAKGQKATVTFPDGSTAFLNSGSTLRYYQNYGLDNRRVNLQGEAFFNVRKDSTKVFTVFTEYLNIEVLGTSFNVYAYENEKVVEMSLISGHVKIETHTTPKNTVFVNPNEKVLLDKVSGKLQIEQTNTDFDTAWMRGELVFRSEPILNVFTKIERRYGVKIHLDEGLDFNDDQFTGYINNEQILDVIKNLQKHYEFSHKIKGDDVWLYKKDQ